MSLVALATGQLINNVQFVVDKGFHGARGLKGPHNKGSRLKGSRNKSKSSSECAGGYAAVWFNVTAADFPACTSPPPSPIDWEIPTDKVFAEFTGFKSFGFVFMPCGHPQIENFGKAHLDAHFYYDTIDERNSWLCETVGPPEAPCKPPPFVQSTEAGEAFFEDPPRSCKPGNDPKNMPAGYVVDMESAIQTSGIHWEFPEQAPRENWTDPVLIMGTYDKCREGSSSSKNSRKSSSCRSSSSKKSKKNKSSKNCGGDSEIAFWELMVPDLTEISSHASSSSLINLTVPALGLGPDSWPDSCDDENIVYTEQTMPSLPYAWKTTTLENDGSLFFFIELWLVPYN